MILEQAQREKVYDLENRYHKRFSFSHLYTGAQYQGFKDFLSLESEDDETETPVPKEKLTELGEVCVWLYGDKKENKEPVIRMQDLHLSQLNKILENREAVAALRDTSDLERAFEFTRPSLALFEESLFRARRELLKAKSYLATGYDGSESLLRSTGTIIVSAESIYDEMEQKRNPKKKKQRLAEYNHL